MTANISHPVVRDEQLYVLIMRRVCVLRWGNLGMRLGFSYVRFLATTGFGSSLTLYSSEKR